MPPKASEPGSAPEEQQKIPPKKRKWTNEEKVKAGVLALFGMAAVAVVGMRSYQIIPAQSYGVDIQAGQLLSDRLRPGFYWKWPAYEKIYIFNNNTIITENTVGEGKNTSDQNAFTADVRLHYRVNPSVGSIALKISAISSDDAASELVTYMNQSVNAAVGSRPGRESLADPAGFLIGFQNNLNWRISQNNLPVQVDSIEILTMHANITQPIQMRVTSSGVVEQMAGPAAVSIYSGGQQAFPTTPALDRQAPTRGPATTTGPRGALVPTYNR